MRYRKIAIIFSTVLILLSLSSLSLKGLNLGLDFSGGSNIELLFDDAVKLPPIRELLAKEKSSVIYFGSDKEILIRSQKKYDAQQIQELLIILQQKLKVDVQLKSSAYIGPQVGDELRDQGGLGLLIALFAIMFYIAIRFQFKFSIGAVIALIHDVVIVIGVFSLLSWEFNLIILAAILAVIGYSLNDTIVVSDRIRENFRELRNQSADKVIDISLNQTLGRTIVTSFTTLLVLIPLWILGSNEMQGFAQALIIGIFIGTYSSIYVVANMLLSLNISSEDLIVPEKEHEIEEIYTEVD